MSRRLVAAIVVGFAVVGCGEDRGQSPTSPDLARGGPAACNYTDVKKYARDLFGSNSAGYDLAQAMSGYEAFTETATNYGFDIFAAIAGKRHEGSGLTAAQQTDAANLVLQVVRCADVTVFGENTTDAYEQAVGPAGAFEVRGGTSVAGVNDPTGPVLSLDLQAGVQAPSNNFLTWLGGRVLVYGYPLSDPFLGGELTGADAGLSGTVTFEWSLVAEKSVTLPRTTKGIFSQCVIVQDDDEIDRLRIEKTTQLLEVQSPVPGLDCPLPTAQFSRRLAPLPFGERLAQLGERLFAPTILHAAALGKSGSPTGSAGSFSPFQVSNPKEVKLRFAQQPKDGTVDFALPTVQVEATGLAGTEWEGVLVRLTAYNNNGQFVTTTGNEATTDNDGLATFTNLVITKTGGYKLRAQTVVPDNDPDVDGFASASVDSRRFNVRP